MTCSEASRSRFFAAAQNDTNRVWRVQSEAIQGDDMPRDHQYHVYIMASRSKTLYVGVTSDLRRRMQQHKEKQVAGFTARYNIDRLVYVEATGDVNAAIFREKEIKGWTREKKIALIESVNLGWADLAENWLVVADES